MCIRDRFGDVQPYGQIKKLDTGVVVKQLKELRVIKPDLATDLKIVDLTKNTQIFKNISELLAPLNSPVLTPPEEASPQITTQDTLSEEIVKILQTTGQKILDEKGIPALTAEVLKIIQTPLPDSSTPPSGEATLTSVSQSQPSQLTTHGLSLIHISEPTRPY